MIQTIFSTLSDGHCGLGTTDEKMRRAAFLNREKLMAQLDICSQKLLTPAQQNGTDYKVVTSDDLGKDRPEVDALITTERGVAIGVLTADCLPLLLADDGRSIAAAVHLRRDSLVEGLDYKVVSKMRELGAEKIKAFIGPCLQKNSHFLDRDTGMRLATLNPKIGNFLQCEWRKSRGFVFDYVAHAIHNLEAMKVEIAEVSPVDTFSSENYFSRRRRPLDNNEGLSLSAICLK